MARLAFTKIYENRIKRFIDAGLNSYSESSSFGTEYFILRISSKEGEGVCELLLGAFWTNTDECDDAFSLLKRFLEGCNHVDRFTMAGTNFKNAETLMDVVIEFSDHDLSNTEKYLYSMEDDEFKKLYQQYNAETIALAKDEAFGIEHDKTKLQKIEVAMNKRLSALGIESIKPVYSCPKCHDEGVVDGKYCECFKKELKKLMDTTTDEADAAKKLIQSIDEVQL